MQILYTATVEFIQRREFGTGKLSFRFNSKRTFQFKHLEERIQFAAEMMLQGHKVSTNIDHILTEREALAEAEREIKLLTDSVDYRF